MTDGNANPATTAKAVAAKGPLDLRSKRVLWLGIVLAVLGGAALLFSMFLWWGGSARDSLGMAVNPWLPGVKTTASGLEFKELEPGKGGHPTDSDVALITYEGKLLDGSTFDMSARPVAFPVREGVPGFVEGLKLMSKGGKYRLWIPGKLGYGDKAVGPIPANATLVFDVRLIDFISQEKYQQFMMQQQMSQSIGRTDAPDAAPADAGNTAAPADNAAAPAIGK
ncbi:MAG: FKBP-type peptidyl-prolyl cis-trans isomerase [Sphingomonas sp.]|uniref:FKBP-type peptidyl-prolyl cis-trans isomerase n=1 Tax=Sphingomonas sp. TaxID=28214 RepID=UPI003F812FE4